MAYCRYCGTSFEAGSKFCPACGMSDADPAAQGAYAAPAMPAQSVNYEARDAQDNKLMGILAYIIVLIPLLAAPKDSRFARYHTNQGLILLILAVAYGIVSWLLGALFLVISWQLALAVSWIFSLAALIFSVLCIIGILHVCKGEMKPLPVIGKFQILK